jgi:predicted dehydrogenase
VPSPLGLECGAAVAKLIADGFLGEVRELIILGATDSMWDDAQPAHWRQDSAISGRNVLALGILHETVLRWLPQPESVFAQSATFSRRAAAPGAVAQRVDLPDVVHVLTRLPGGASGLYHLSGMALFGPPLQIHLYGRRGTIKVEFGDTERVWIGAAGDRSLRELEIPAAERAGWRVEEEFVQAIGAPKSRTSRRRTLHGVYRGRDAECGVGNAGGRAARVRGALDAIAAHRNHPSLAASRALRVE